MKLTDKKRATPRELVTPAVLQILLSLSAGRRHGYGIKRDVEARTVGRMKLGPGTLYEAIHRLLRAGLVEHATAPSAGGVSARRKYYRLTSTGRKLMLEELTRLEEIVAFARDTELLPGKGSR